MYVHNAQPLAEGEEKHVISVFVADESGLINRVAGVFARRGERLRFPCRAPEAVHRIDLVGPTLAGVGLSQLGALQWVHAPQRGFGGRASAAAGPASCAVTASLILTVAGPPATAYSIPCTLYPTSSTVTVTFLRRASATAWLHTTPWNAGMLCSFASSVSVCRGPRAYQGGHLVPAFKGLLLRCRRQHRVPGGGPQHRQGSIHHRHHRHQVRHRQPGEAAQQARQGTPSATDAPHRGGNQCTAVCPLLFKGRCRAASPAEQSNIREAAMGPVPMHLTGSPHTHQGSRATVCAWAEPSPPEGWREGWMDASLLGVTAAVGSRQRWQGPLRRREGTEAVLLPCIPL